MQATGGKLESCLRADELIEVRIERVATNGHHTVLQKGALPAVESKLCSALSCRFKILSYCKQTV